MKNTLIQSANYPFIKYLLIALISLTTCITSHAQNENILSLKFGMVSSTINFSNEGSPISNFPDRTSPSLAIALKHQLHPAFRLGIEAGFLSEARNVKWSYIINPDETVETEGNFQRNSWYMMFIPEFSLPELKWLYVNVGAGLIHHFQNQYSNASQRILPFSASAIPIRNLDILVPSGTGFITKIGLGIQFPINNSVMIGMDASHFSTSLYNAKAGYYEIINTPPIGFRGWIVAVNLGFIFNK